MSIRFFPPVLRHFQPSDDDGHCFKIRVEQSVPLVRRWRKQVRNLVNIVVRRYGLEAEMAEMLLRLCADDLSAEQLNVIALQFSRSIVRETDMEARPYEEMGQIGERGDPVTLATIALAFVTSGAAVSLLKVFETYASRKRSLEIELSRSDGRKMKISAQGVSAQEIEKTTQLLRDFVHGSDHRTAIRHSDSE
jgi:hypothetical protein